MPGGFGNTAFGQNEFGQATSALEPRFEDSSPSDGATGVSIYDVVVNFTVYGFSSRVQTDDSLLVEVSEDGGSTYVDAYKEGAFVSPFDGSNSEVDDHQSHPNALLIRLHKTSTWTDEKEIRVRTTGYDEYGQEATKETPVIWGS